MSGRELKLNLHVARGLFRTEYRGSTLRERFGLDRPGSGYSAGDAGRARILA